MLILGLVAFDGRLEKRNPDPEKDRLAPALQGKSGSILGVVFPSSDNKTISLSVVLPFLAGGALVAFLLTQSA